MDEDDIVKRRRTMSQGTVKAMITGVNEETPSMTLSILPSVDIELQLSPDESSEFTMIGPEDNIEVLHKGMRQCKVSDESSRPSPPMSPLSENVLEQLNLADEPWAFFLLSTLTMRRNSY